VGSALFLRSGNAGGSHAQVAGFEIQPQLLKHVIDLFGGLVVVEGAATSMDRQVILERLTTLRKGETISYSLITDRGKAIAGSAVVKEVTTKVRSDGRLFFAITMRRGRG
jgi:hypothetical protein